MRTIILVLTLALVSTARADENPEPAPFSEAWNRKQGEILAKIDPAPVDIVYTPPTVVGTRVYTASDLIRLRKIQIQQSEITYLQGLVAKLCDSKDDCDTAKLSEALEMMSSPPEADQSSAGIQGYSFQIGENAWNLEVVRTDVTPGIFTIGPAIRAE